MHVYSLIDCLPLILVVSIFIISSLCYFLLPQMSWKQSVIVIHQICSWGHSPASFNLYVYSYFIV